MRKRVMLKMINFFHIRRTIYCVLSLCFLYGIVQLLWLRYGENLLDDTDRLTVLKQISSNVNALQVPNVTYGGQACRHPQLEIKNPDIMKFIKDSPPIDCGNQLDWVEISGGVAKIRDEAKILHGDIECSFADIVRVSDKLIKNGPTTVTHTDYELQDSDFVRVTCKGNGAKWKTVMAGIRRDPEILERTGWGKVPADGLHLNVLIWGFDSLSRNMFIRKLPQSFDYLKNHLKAIVLEGYNIVGDGTPQALIPILTGRTELELPETRKRMGDKASYVNIYPFVWKDFRKNGYVTAYTEDSSSIGTFTYRLKGFDEPPTDHYMRPYYLAAEPEYRAQEKFCMGSVPRHKVMMNYIREFFTVYRDKPKFSFSFHSELSHDSYNNIGGADKDLLNFVKGLESDGHLNNTLLIVMSDHGHRFTAIRDTQQGKQEERLPNFIFVFPPWFEQKYPEAIANFRTNAHRLATPFDINPTLKNILHFDGAGKGDIRNRSISLFKEIPTKRTCADAFIEPHWCACLVWEKVDTQDAKVQQAAKALIDFINRYTSEHRDLCNSLRLTKVIWAGKLLPTPGLLHFKKNADMDGFIADMTDHTEVSQELYQVKVQAEPGGGIFEASLQHSIKEGSFRIKADDISRINKYGKQAHCIEDTYEQLRKYCYCKTLPPA